MRVRRVPRRLAAAVGATTLVGSLVAVPPGVASGSTTDHVRYWNTVLLDVFKNLKMGDAAPTRLSRTAAMMNAAAYDGANSAACATTGGCIGQPYLTRVAVPSGALPDASTAIDYAAYQALKGLYPKASYPQFDFDAKLEAAQNTIPGSVSQAQRDQGAAVGARAAQVMAATRANDGSGDTITYTPGSRPGDWRDTGSGPALTPHWGSVKPFTMITPNNFRPSYPMGAQSLEELIGNSTYEAHVEEVRNVGRLNASPAYRSADKTQAAHFWANDLDGTYKPPGQLIAHTMKVAELLPGQTELKNARLFALVSLAMGDAGIAAWDAKYRTDIDLWRPDTAIQHSPTNPDPSWEPQSRRTDGTTFSPPFPAFISGHGTFGGAWSRVMERYVGTDNFTFDASTDDPFAQGVTRTFTKFSAAAEENAFSRVWLGVHYRFDGEYSLTTGRSVAEQVTQNYLGPPSSGQTLVSDAFGRTASGGFGTADTGGDWWVGAPLSDYSVNGGTGQIIMPVPGAGRSAFTDRVLTTDSDLTFKFATNKAATGNGTYVTAVGRKVNGAGTYRVVTILRPNGTVSLQLRRADASGAETAIGTEQAISGLSHAAGTPLRIRLQVVGTAPTTLRAKVWADGSAEPASWQLTATDSTGELQGAGSAGLLTAISGAATNAPVTVSIDDVKVVRVTE